jgi:hypothetical protein
LSKPELEFFDTDSVEPSPVEGRTEGLSEKILAQDPDTGAASRILYFQPGTDTSPNGVQVHDFWEEVYILEGSIVDLSLNEEFTQGMYACRPPGMKHGPWTSPNGCKTFEVRYHAREG